MSSAERSQTSSPAFLEARRRSVGLSRLSRRRNSFKSPLLKTELVVTSASGNSTRHKINVTESFTPNVEPKTCTQSVSTVSICSTVPNAPNHRNVNKGSSPFSAKDTFNSRIPASTGLESRLGLQECGDNSSTARPISQRNAKLDHGEASSAKLATMTCSVNCVRPSQVSTPSSSRKRPQTQKNIFGKKFKAEFKSPVRSVMGEESMLHIEESIGELKRRLQSVEDQIKNLQESGYELEEVQRFMTKLHEYNELKDIGQFLIGQIACKEGTTTKQVYGRFGLNLED